MEKTLKESEQALQAMRELKQEYVDTCSRLGQAELDREYFKGKASALRVKLKEAMEREANGE